MRFWAALCCRVGVAATAVLTARTCLPETLTAHLTTSPAVAHQSNDDVRQEVFALQLLELVRSVCHRAGVAVWLKPYRIIATRSVDAAPLLRVRPRGQQRRRPPPGPIVVLTLHCFRSERARLAAMVLWSHRTLSIPSLTPSAKRLHRDHRGRARRHLARRT